jgi:hypothetical protein
MPSNHPTAHRVAPRIQAHFARHIRAARDGFQLPTSADIETVIDAGFWTSLRREEGLTRRLSLALVPPTAALHPLVFERSVPLDPSALVKIAPAVERPNIHLGVWRAREGAELRVWGTTRSIPPFAFVLEASAPGLLVVKHQRTQGGKFVNVAVLEGDRVKVIDEDASSLPDCPQLLTSLLGFDVRETRTSHQTNLLAALAVAMRVHAHGGSLLVVPADDSEWRESIVHPISYSVAPAFREIGDLLDRPLSERMERAWQDALADAVSAVAGLTAVDGATVLDTRHRVLAFGAKIMRRKGQTPVERVTVTEPVEDSRPIVTPPSSLGGTRHLSAAQFVQDQQRALALIASQDGAFTVFAWSPAEGMVHAHRVETLLL